MIFGIANDFDAAATLRDRLPLGHGVGRIIGSLRMNVRSNLPD
jgi:hypothetical protein